MPASSTWHFARRYRLAEQMVASRARRCLLDIYLDDQQLRLKSGSSLPLQVGMSLTANIKLRKVSYLQLLLGEFQDKAESLQRL